MFNGRWTHLALDGGDTRIEPIGVILSAYLKLKLRLRLAGFDPIFHLFDWRRNIAKEGTKLADRIR